MNFPSTNPDTFNPLAETADKIREAVERGENIVRQIEYICREAAPSNVILELLYRDRERLIKAGVDLQDVIIRLPWKGYLGISGIPDLPALFKASSQLSRVRIIEALLVSDRPAQTLTLVESIQDEPVEYADLYALTCIVLAYRNFDYEAGLMAGRRFLSQRPASPLCTEILRWVIFEFLDFACAETALSDAELNISPNSRRHFSEYIAFMRTKVIESANPSLSPLAGADVAEALALIRFRNMELMFPRLPRALIDNLHIFPNWHAQRALTSFIKSCIHAGYVDDINVFLSVVDELLQHNHVSAAIRFFFGIDVFAKSAISFDQFKLIQKIIISTKDRMEMAAAVDRAAAMFDRYYSSEMVVELSRLAECARRVDLPPKTAALEYSCDSGIICTTQRQQALNTPVVAQYCRTAEASYQPSVAICLSGQLRSFGQHWQTMLARVVEPLRADLFISTWDFQGFGVGYQGLAERILPSEILCRLSDDLHEAGALFTRFPTLYNKLLEFSDQSSHLLTQLPGIASWRVRDEQAFEQYIATNFPKLSSTTRFQKHVKGQHPAAPPSSNQLKMYFSMWDSFLLMRSYAHARKHHYDIVVKMRPDMKIIDFSAHAMLQAKTADDVVYVNHYHTRGVSDQMAFGSQWSMEAYMSAFALVVDAGGFAISPLSYGHGSESLAFDNLVYRGIRCASADVAHYELSSRIMTVSAFAEVMLQDIENGTHVDPLRQILEELAGRFGTDSKI